eukprot:UN33398
MVKKSQSITEKLEQLTTVYSSDEKDEKDNSGGGAESHNSIDSNSFDRYSSVFKNGFVSGGFGSGFKKAASDDGLSGPRLGGPFPRSLTSPTASRTSRSPNRFDERSIDKRLMTTPLKSIGRCKSEGPYGASGKGFPDNPKFGRRLSAKAIETNKVEKIKKGKRNF